MLTNKGKYGLKALIALARLGPGETAFSNDIAKANNIPKKFLDTILLEFRNAGLVRSKKGPTGGHALARPSSEIHVGQAIRIIDGPLAPIRCASRSAYEVCEDCLDPETCLVRRAMCTARDAVSDVLDSMSLEQLLSANPGAPEAALLRKNPAL